MSGPKGRKRKKERMTEGGGEMRRRRGEKGEGGKERMVQACQTDKQTNRHG